MQKYNLLNIFSVLATSKNTFEGQLPDEHVIKVVRRHWFTLVRPVAFTIFLIFIPFIIYLTFVDFMTGEFVMFYWFLATFFYLFLWYGIFFQIMLYLLDMWIITDHKIIDSQLHFLFSRSVSELNLRNIQDMSVDVHGFFPTLLNFGNLEIQTAGAEKKFNINGVPDPIAVKNMIMKAHRSYARIHPKGHEEEAS